MDKKKISLRTTTKKRKLQWLKQKYGIFAGLKTYLSKYCKYNSK
jgi:hypothetical protein